jgi:hypothetical protein
MKRRGAVFALSVVVATTAIILSADEKSIAGRWNISAEGYKMTMVLTQDGGKIAGTLDSPHGPVKVNGEVDKGWLEFSGASDTKPHAIEILAKGILRADGTLAGVMITNVGEFTWTAVRDD